jgi:uncharacterized phage protein (TIGR01671 family)
MNDRYLFRVWDKRQNEYIEAPNPMPLLQANGLLAYFTNNPEAMDFYVVEFCIGLKDKTEKLIFENDIVDITVHANGFSQEHLIGIIATVKYSIQKAKFYLLDIKTKNEWEFYDIMSCEVIGNIHQDSHLLGGK